MRTILDYTHPWDAIPHPCDTETPARNAAADAAIREDGMAMALTAPEAKSIDLLSAMAADAALSPMLDGLLRALAELKSGIAAVEAGL